MTDRERFEQIISASPFEKSVARWPNLPVKFAWPGGYKDLNVDLAWCIWQASRKQAMDETENACLDLLQSGPAANVTDALRNIGIRHCVEAIRALANPEGEQG